MGIKKLNLFVTNFDSCAILLAKNFNVVQTARIFYDNGKIDTNFEAILMFDVCMPNHVAMTTRYYPIPVIGMERLTKIEQHMLLVEMGIRTPKTYDCFVDEKGKNTVTMNNVLSNISPDTDIILKPYLGARGIGQVKLKKGELQSRLYDICNKRDDELKKVEESNANNKGNKGYLAKEISGGNFCVQIYEKSIEQEYRILYFFGNEPIIMERNKSDNTWQANLGAHPDNSTKYVGSDLTKIIGNENAKIVNNLFNRTNTPFLSIDIYIDKNGDLGILEFQMEFGCAKVPENILYKRINSSVNKMINKKLSHGNN